MDRREMLRNKLKEEEENGQDQVEKLRDLKKVPEPSKKKDVEEGEIDAYMDSDNHPKDAPSHADELDYCNMRYEQIKMEYKSLMLQKGEVDSSGREDQQSTLRRAFSNNYKARKWAVNRLRQLGQKVKDRFVPGN